MLRIIILFISLISLISNYFIFNSSQYQSILLNDAKNGGYSVNESDLINFNYNYPSLALNSVPLSTYVSRYYTNNDKFDIAISLLEESLVANPNSFYSEYLISRNYIFINDFLKAEKHLESIFLKAPKIESSSALYLSILEKNQNKEALNKIFKKMIKIDNELIWSYYLSALKNNTQTPIIKETFIKATNYFKKNFNF